MFRKYVKKLFVAILTASVVISAANVATPGKTAEAGSNIIADGWYYIKDIGSQKYLDVAGGNDSNGTNVQQWKGIGGDAQKWYVTNLGSNYITIRSGLKGGRMLDVNGGKADNGTNIQIWVANGRDSQTFKVKKISSGVVALQTKCSNNKQAVDVNGSSSSDGANVITMKYT